VTRLVAEGVWLCADVLEVDICGQVRSSFQSSGMACQMPGGFALFDRVVLIYNPANRRVPLTLAESMRWELGRGLPVVPVALQPTQHAGHARELTLCVDWGTTGHATSRCACLSSRLGMSQAG
jgi:hypothetical protein